MTSPFAALGREFAQWCQYINGDDDATVTVQRTDPQTGEATNTAEGVAALKLTSTGQPVKVGGGGLLGADECQFWLVGMNMDFKPERDDRIAEPDGTTWNINLVESVGYTATGTLYRCPVTLARSDASS